MARRPPGRFFRRRDSRQRSTRCAAGPTLPLEAEWLRGNGRRPVERLRPAAENHLRLILLVQSDESGDRLRLLSRAHDQETRGQRIQRSGVSHFFYME